MSVLNKFSLEGKLAVVTGASSGIGQGMATALADAGADIINLSLPFAEGRVAETEAMVTGMGRKYSFYATDFSDRQSLYASIKAVKEEFGKIDILINNAGMILRAPIAEHSDEYWDKVMEVNLNAQYIITREFGRDMIEQGSGKIIFICSLLTFQGGITVPGYAASKAGVGRLVMAFANEWAAKGVNVNGIAPGYIATANTQALRDDAERSAAILSRIPAGRWGVPEDFMGPAIFLSSAASGYMSGHIMVVDGGWMGR